MIISNILVIPWLKSPRRKPGSSRRAFPVWPEVKNKTVLKVIEKKCREKGAPLIQGF
jgi:hypothetical protein